MLYLYQKNNNMECRKLEIEWAWRVECTGDDRHSIWEGTNQDGKKVRVYVAKIEQLPDDQELHTYPYQT